MLNFYLHTSRNEPDPTTYASRKQFLCICLTCWSNLLSKALNLLRTHITWGILSFLWWTGTTSWTTWLDGIRESIWIRISVNHLISYLQPKPCDYTGTDQYGYYTCGSKLLHHRLLYFPCPNMDGRPTVTTCGRLSTTYSKYKHVFTSWQVGVDVLPRPVRQNNVVATKTT